MEGGHIVLLPFMAQGHIIPFLSLAKLLAHRNPSYTITLVNTPLNISKLRSSLPPGSTIRLAELPFRSSDHGLPTDVENTDALPLHLFLPFFHAAETLRSSFEQLLSGFIRTEGSRCVCIIADFFHGWTVQTAKKLGVFHSVFVTSGAFSSAVSYSLWLHPPVLDRASLEEEEEGVPLTDFPEVRLHRSQVTNMIIPGDGSDPVTCFMRRNISLTFNSDGLLVNTVETLEKAGLKLLKQFAGVPVWPVGPLIRLPSFPTPAGGEDCTMRWLDLQVPASVLYISFGSQNSIPATDMAALARALEESKKPFIWAIRAPVEFESEKEFSSKWLPEGFEERTKKKKQGIVMKGWAPQMKILSHLATGAFLSHCGWNSVLESLSLGVPVIGWPLLADQIYNSRMVEEMGVGVEVGRGRSEGGLGKKGWEGLKEKVEIVMGETETGREMRRRASEVREMMRIAAAAEGGGGQIQEFLRTAFFV